MTECRLVTEAASVLAVEGFVSHCVNVIRHTCENSGWLSAVFFRHVVADVTSCVTRCKQAFDVE